MDIENLGSAPDIENFDPSNMDRGDVIEEVKTEPVEEPKEEPKEEPTEEPKEEPTEEPKDEPTEEPKEEPEDKPRDEKGRFEAKIPKSRFDEQVGKERAAREAAEARAAELERQLRSQEAVKIKTQEIEGIEATITELETKHAELLLDGNSKEAAAVMKEIRHAERQIARAEADALADRRISQTLEAQKFDTVVARLEADYPQFNPESEAYDSDLVELVLTKQQKLMQNEGLSPSQAMEKAAKGVAERFAKAPEPAKDDTKGLAAAKAEDRKQQQLSKNLDTIKKQPANMKESGIDSDKAGVTALPDVMSMSQDEFNALPESTKAKLRGDFV